MRRRFQFRRIDTREHAMCVPSLRPLIIEWYVSMTLSASKRIAAT
jgi:hypothetical protein